MQIPSFLLEFCGVFGFLALRFPALLPHGVYLVEDYPKVKVPSTSILLVLGEDGRLKKDLGRSGKVRQISMAYDGAMDFF